VHTPEFDVEHDLDNVRRAAKDLHVDYPIATDNDYAVWTAFDNHYWPALYFVDAQGNIRHHQFGEGQYEQSEMAYAAPARLRLNHWALAGAWTVHPQVVVLDQAEGRIVYRFHARDLHLVMGPAAQGTPIRFRVRIDGAPPGASHGTDVDDQGNGTLTQPRLYQLIRQPGPISERTFEITFLDPGVQAYSFTFG
jgi:hypothetical protein